jgi:(2Fe-2S) ferredoxin
MWTDLSNATGEPTPVRARPNEFERIFEVGFFSTRIRSDPGRCGADLVIARRREKPGLKSMWACVRAYPQSSPMRSAEFAPRVHLFVCTNHRAADSPLGSGCAQAGEALFDALKKEVAARRDFTRVWITQTACMGICPKQGAACARYPEGTLLTEVEASDAKAIYDGILPARGRPNDEEKK